MLRRSLQQFSNFSLGFLLSVTAMLALFIYKVSPLRDPAFQPSGANAGSLIPRLRSWSDADWALGALILAVLLATNLTIVLRGRQATRTTEEPLISFVAWLAIWSVFFGTFWLTFTVYLLNQWLID